MLNTLDDEAVCAQKMMKVTFPQRLTGAVSEAQPLCTVSPPFCYHRKNPTFGNSVRLLGVCAEMNLYIFTHFRRLSNA